MNGFDSQLKDRLLGVVPHVYLKDSDFRGFLKVAKDFLENNPSAPEAPRLAYDFMMVGKAASDVDSVKYATNLLLFNYTQSLPSLNFIMLIK